MLVTLRVLSVRLGLPNLPLSFNSDHIIKYILLKLVNRVKSNEI